MRPEYRDIMLFFDGLHETAGSTFVSDKASESLNMVTAMRHRLDARSVPQRKSQKIANPLLQERSTKLAMRTSKNSYFIQTVSTIFNRLVKETKIF